MNYPKEKRMNGDTYTLQCEDEFSVVYYSEMYDTFEVHKKRYTQNDYTFPNGSTTVKGTPMFASVHAFGQYAFNCTTLEKAKEKMKVFSPSN